MSEVDRIDGLDLIGPRAYGLRGVPHKQWKALRHMEGLQQFTPKGFEPFWAVTRHDEICEISKQPEHYLSRFGIVLESDSQREIIESGLRDMRTIISMDPPDHRDFRKVAAPWFTPRQISSIAPVVEESARHLIDDLVERASGGGGEGGVATDVAAPHPLRILSTILGVPREKEADLLRLTNELFASDDPDLQREGEDRNAALQEIAMEFVAMFQEIIADRRANPTDDLASLLANAEVDGAPMGPVETLGYYLITFTAGHDTTKNALAGGLLALAEHPEEYEKLKANPELVNSAVEEIVRWTSPVNYMKRVVAEDIEFRGQKLKKGENLILFYASANRDESMFEDPDTFRIDRSPNPHLAFGIGEHFCLGTHLARQSQRALLRELIARIDTLEVSGEPSQIESSFVVGLKKLPLRYRVQRAA